MVISIAAIVKSDEFTWFLKALPTYNHDYICTDTDVQKSVKILHLFMSSHGGRATKFVFLCLIYCKI